MYHARLLDICIPTYNRSTALAGLIKFFDSELDSLSNKITRFIKVIISDNASNDNTSRVVHNLIKNNILHKENFMYVRNNHNLGIVANAYKSINYTSSKYIWVMGDDDILEKGILQQILTITKDYDPNFIFLRHDLMVGNRKSSMLCCDIQPGWHEDCYDMIREHLHLNTNALGLTSAVIFKSFILNKILRHLPLDGKYDYGWSYLAGIYAAVSGKGYFEGNIYLHKQSYGCSWQNIYFHAVYGSFCSLQKLKKLGCDKNVIQEIQKSYIEETDILHELIEHMIINNNRKICIQFLLQLLKCDIRAVVRKISN